MAPVAMAGSVPPVDRISSHSDESIEERCFSACLICLEGHYTAAPSMGPLTAAKVTSMVSKTLEKTHTFKDVREALSKNVAIWMYLTKIFASAVPHLSKLSVGPLAGLDDPDKGVSPQESTALILKNYVVIKEDLQILNKLMHIARNLLVTSEPEVPQDICAAVHFDQMVYQTIILCVNVTSKGYDGEVLDEMSRRKLNDITDLYKKIMVTSLQQAHNWTAKNDRNKMSFWCDVLFDDDATADDDETGFSIDCCKTEVQNWLERNANMCDKARELLKDYARNHAHQPPGPLPPISPLARNWLSDGDPRASAGFAGIELNPARPPLWKEDEPSKFDQDHLYGRVSHEIDMWWRKARDENYSEWKVPMPSVEFAQKRAEACKASLLQHYPAFHEGDFEDEDDVGETEGEVDAGAEGAAANGHGESNGHAIRSGAENDSRSLVQGYVDDMNGEDEEEDDDPDNEDADSYGDGPMTGLLTEIPNILDPKQIEALHMIVKSCIVEPVNSGGLGGAAPRENLQQTRCRLFIALECGKSLLREMLVFIAVWEKDESSLIFQITTQIVEALHHNALLPYTWRALRIPKDITSPAQTVLLRLISHMYRTLPKTATPAAIDAPEPVVYSGKPTAPPPATVTATPAASATTADPSSPSPSSSASSSDTVASSDNRVRLLHFLFSNFRSRIVPECLALMVIQAHIREKDMDEAEFPVDNWDMERAKDGLAQFLDFLITAAEDFELRTKLIEWDATYELVTLLRNLERAVKKKPLVQTMPPAVQPQQQQQASSYPPPPALARTQSGHDQYATDGSLAHPTPPPPPPPPMTDQAPPMQEPAWQYPWPEVKCQVLAMLAALLQPPPGKTRPGNEVVQRRIVQYNGMAALLNSSLHDENNLFARERVQLCLKWLLDGGVEANQFVNNLVKVKEAEEQQTQALHARAQQAHAQAQAQAHALAQAQARQGATAGAAAAGPSAAGTAAAPATAGGGPEVVTPLRIDGIEGTVNVKIKQRAAQAKLDPHAASIGAALFGLMGASSGTGAAAAGARPGAAGGATTLPIRSAGRPETSSSSPYNDADFM